VQQSSQPKICGICGRDCSAKPRIRDPRGRYFCRECYEAALQRKRAGAQHDQPPPEPHPASSALEEEPNVLDDLIAQSAPSPTSADASSYTCPRCGAPHGLTAVICTNCGYNLRTGEETPAPPPAPPVLKTYAGGGGAWPAVIGTISVVLGGGGALINGMNVHVNVAGQRDLGQSPLPAILAGAVSILLSLWLLLAGIGIIRRQSTAVSNIRKWAIVKIVLYGTCLTCVTGVLLFAADAAAKQDPRLAQFGDAKAIVLIVMIVLIAWFLAWPIFILWWFGRDKVREDIRDWR
jgi:ribosomal protein L40E